MEPLSSWDVVANHPQQLVEDCRNAACNDDAFSRFKSGPRICNLTGGQTRRLAVPFWQYATYHWPDCFSHRRFFQRIDSIGGLHERQSVANDFSISPNLAKDIATLATTLRCFPSLEGLRIAEIGGGFGQLASIIMQTQQPKAYTIFDVLGVSELQQRYTREVGIGKVDSACQYPLSEIPLDLIIVNYEYAPIPEYSRSQLLRYLLAKIPRGFITWGQAGYSSRDSMVLPAGIFNCDDLSGWKHPQKPFQQAWGIND